MALVELLVDERHSLSTKIGLSYTENAETIQRQTINNALKQIGTTFASLLLQKLFYKTFSFSPRSLQMSLLWPDRARTHWFNENFLSLEKLYRFILLVLPIVAGVEKHLWVGRENWFRVQPTTRPLPESSVCIPKCRRSHTKNLFIRTTLCERGEYLKRESVLLCGGNGRELILVAIPEKYKRNRGDLLES